MANKVAFTDYGSNSKLSVVVGPATLMSFSCQNENAQIRYFQIFNLAAAPTEDSSVPLFSFAIPGGNANWPGYRAEGEEFFGKDGFYLGTGFAWGISVDPDVFDSTGIVVGEHQVNGIYLP